MEMSQRDMWHLACHQDANLGELVHDRISNIYTPNSFMCRVFVSLLASRKDNRREPTVAHSIASLM